MDDDPPTLTVDELVSLGGAPARLEADGDGVTIGPNGTPATFSSIPRSFWWTLVTLTTVGYGDFYPTTDQGKTLAVVTMFCGILILAMPITIPKHTVSTSTLAGLIGAHHKRSGTRIGARGISDLVIATCRIWSLASPASI